MNGAAVITDHLHRKPWDGIERRRLNDGDYTGSERRGGPASLDPRILEARLRQLESQMADIAVTMREAVASGIRQALTDPGTLSDMGKAARGVAVKAAKEETGGWVWRTLGGSVSGVALRLAVLWFVLKLAGVDAAAKAWAILKGT